MTSSTAPPALTAFRRRPAATSVFVLGVVIVGFIFVAIGIVGTMLVGSQGSGGGGRWSIDQLDLYTLLLGLVGSIAAVAMVTTGAVLVTRLPRHVIGWFLLIGGLCLTLAFGASALANMMLDAGLPGSVWFEWLGSVTWIPAIVLIGIFVPLYFPTGHLPSPRWRIVALIAIVAMVFSTLQTALTPFTPGDYPAGIENPVAVSGTAADLVNLLGTLGTIAGVICFPLVAAAFIIRFRRSSGIERAQLKWFAAAIAVVGPALPVGIATSRATSDLGILVGNLAYLFLFTGFVLVPIAIGIAVLRYRLFEIDRLISRTVVYAVLIGALGATYLGTVLLLQVLLASFASSNELAVAASTLVVAGLFQPVRSRLKRAADRRFNRVRYDAEAELNLFVIRLRDEVDLTQVKADVAGTIERIMQPTAVSIWLRNQGPKRA